MADEPKPQLRIEGGYTVIDDVTVKLRIGFFSLPCALISKECSLYPRSVYIAKTAVNPEDALRGHHIDENTAAQLRGSDPRVGIDARSIMDLMMLMAQPGDRLRIAVEGSTEEATRLALRLYSGITTADDVPDFSRFEDK